MDFLVCGLIKVVGIHVEVLLEVFFFEMMSMLWWSAGWIKCWRFCVQTHVFQDFSYYFWIFDGSDDFHSAAAFGASLNVDVENPCK